MKADPSWPRRQNLKGRKRKGYHHKGSRLLIPSKRQGQIHRHLLGPVPRRGAGVSIAWHSMGMPQKKRSKERRGWGGTWCLEWDQWLSFNLGAVSAGRKKKKNEKGLRLLSCSYTQKSQRGSTSTAAAATPLADRKTRRVQRYSCRQNPAKKKKGGGGEESLLKSLFFWGDRRQAAGLLDVVPRTTSEEAAVCKRRRIGPRIKDGWRRKESSVSKEGVLHNWSKSVSLNKLTWAEATVRTRLAAKRVRLSRTFGSIHWLNWLGGPLKRSPSALFLYFFIFGCMLMSQNEGEANSK